MGVVKVVDGHLLALVANVTLLAPCCYLEGRGRTLKVASVSPKGSEVPFGPSLVDKQVRGRVSSDPIIQRNLCACSFRQ
jgi:hypothetical protein